MNTIHSTYQYASDQDSNIQNGNYQGSHHRSNYPLADVLAAVGNTPLIQLNRIYPDAPIQLYGKLEAVNPGGSIKDRTAHTILTAAFSTGELKPGATVIESSSGNMAIGLAQTCRYLGLNLIVVVDPNVNRQTVKILRAYGAQIDQVEELDPTGGYLKTRLRRVQTLLDVVPNSYWPNQYANAHNPLAHRRTMDEIVTALGGKLDYLFAATSTCGTLMGCAQYVRESGLSTKIIAVDAMGSAIFNSPPAKRLLPGHGAGRRPELLDEQYVDRVIYISDRECVIGCRRLLDREALLCGGSSGAVTMAVEKMLPELPRSASCAVILCDRGERYLDTIYSTEWVAEHLGQIEDETTIAPHKHEEPLLLL